MNFIGKIQNQYEQLWKLIIRPSKSTYNEQFLGSSFIQLKKKNIIRKDFQLTNKRGYHFACSLWLPTSQQSYSCVVYLHGNSSNRLEGMEYLRKLLIKNIALCTFDFSGSGNAQGQYISLGYYEQQDLYQVIQHLKKYPQINKIGIWGRSMGAVTALLYLKDNKQISAAVYDSPFKSLKDLVEDMGSKTSKIPSFILNGGLKIISKTILDKAKFNIFQLNPYKTCAPSITTPAFFIVAISDQIIPIEHTKDLFQVYGTDDKIIKMVKGKHNDKRPPSCKKEVIKFLIKHLQNKQQKEGLQYDQNQISKQQSQEIQIQTQNIVQETKRIKLFNFGFFQSKKQKKQVKSNQKAQSGTDPQLQQVVKYQNNHNSSPKKKQNKRVNEEVKEFQNHFDQQQWQRKKFEAASKEFCYYL